ncbi:ImmA/IrrE family metallo-endopeptidase [Leuconostocaceae bacterium ESL0723]|nr:ImmA/IrrE family metallo-endopeptidase [Leuconostocaceae bacterium ESL0723]
MSYKIGEVYSRGFLDKYFHDDSIYNLKHWIKQYEVDIYKFVEFANLRIQISEEGFNKSGEYNSSTKTITVNQNEPVFRERFTIAHELGHALLQHKGDSSGISNRLLSPYGQETQEIVKKIFNDRNEVDANNFAAEILMPKKVVDDALHSIAKQKNWDVNNVDWRQSDELVMGTAMLMNVSAQSMRFRLQNIGY